MQLEGTLKIINETQTFDSGFTKREVILTTNEQYPQDIPVEFIKDKTSLLDVFKVGDSVKISINLRGSQWKERYFLSAVGWRIEKAGQAAPQEASVSAIEIIEDAGGIDDLPF